VFWKGKAGARGALPEQRDEANAMASQLLECANVDFDRSSPLQQALVGTFLFGMLSAQCMSKKQPGDPRALAIYVFRDTLHYTPEAAEQGVQSCIEVTKPGVHDTMNDIVHRGIDGHRQFVEGDFAGLRTNIGDVLQQFNAAP
jgi:hypothetical protein